MKDKNDPAIAGQNDHPQELGFLLAAIFWTLMIAILATWQQSSDRQAALENAQATARQSFAKDLLIRRWATEHGGVYVPVTPASPPNPYLSHLPERDITTPSGRSLTLLNPAYIIRQIHQFARASSNHGHGHITSLEPIRPENAPDNWEKSALAKLAGGEPEWSSLEWLEGETYLRLMRPIIMEPACLQCHPEQPVGSIRGGIAVSIPWAPFQATLAQKRTMIWLGHGAIWLLGLAGLGFARHHLLRHLCLIRQSEQRQRQSEERYRLLTEGTLAIPWEFDLGADRWTYIAPQVAKVLGYSPEEWRDLRFWEEHIHPEDRRRVLEHWRSCAEQGRDRQFEYRFLKKDGHIAWLKTLTTVEMSAGRPIRIRGVMLDLTEHRIMEEKLRQASKMEAVGTLAAGVAHDFNNILTSLISFTTLVKRRHLDDEISRDYLQEILDGANRAAELTRSLLAYSRKLEIQLKPEDLNDIVDKNRKMLRRLIRENIEIATELTESELPVLADRTLIEQVLMNLAGNAQDAMPMGGTLTIGTGRIDSLSQVNQPASSAIPLPCAILTVSDSGIGIDPDKLERIFDPFFTTKAVGRGTGLGLAQVYGIVQQHNGTITVDSEPDGGSVFTIFLPLHTSRSEADDRTKIGASPSTTGKTLTILLVEDEPQVRKVLQRLLTSQGHRVLEAAQGEEALQLLRRQPQGIDLVIMDVIMPGMSGRETYREMRAIRADIKVLFISGYPGDVITVQNIRDEQLELLAKPLVPQELMQKIKEMTNK
ncbi:ATP-binding protein [Desulfurivibrio sp. D14AmB]|uniref:ATP-binding response regulator n=1 Tax=Desulfurivibrio sp. D14AmB TaxID=3374370 RepID=UPI00376EB7C1